MAFPSTILSLAHAAASNFLSVWYGGVTPHSTGDNMIIDDLVAVEQKVGLGVSTPSEGQALKGTAAGNSFWDVISARNLIANGGLEEWNTTSFGTAAFTTATDTPIARDWVARREHASDTLTAAQETTIIDSSEGGRYSLKLVKANSNGLASARVNLPTSLVNELRGRAVTIRARIRQGVASNVRASINDGSLTSTGTSPTTGTFLALSVQRTISPSATAIWIGVELGVAANSADTVYVDNVSLTLGGVPELHAPAVMTPLVPSVHAAGAGAQTIAQSTNTAIGLGGTDVADNDNMHDPSTNPSRVTIQKDGTYLLIGAVNWSAGTSGARLIFFRKNGTTTLGQSNTTSAIAFDHVLPITAALVAGDYVELMAFQDSVVAGLGIGSGDVSRVRAIKVA